MAKTSAVYNDVIKAWKETPLSCTESQLTTFLISSIYKALDLGPHQVKTGNLGKGSGLIPDGLIYQDLDKPPVLVLDNKKRVPELAQASDEDFVKLCLQEKSLYREALGYPDNNPKNNGIKQYLDNSNEKIQPDCLASYGLVFNGDFFQIFRRVDGLILPLTPLQRMTEATIPELMRQLKYCLKQPKRGLVATVWNRKGGVGKTTNTINIAAVLALAGKKVLLIDLDVQNDLTRGLLPKWDAKKHEEDYLKLCIDKLNLKSYDEAKQILTANIHTRKFPVVGQTGADKQDFSLDILPNHRKWLEVFRDNETLNQTQKITLMQRLIKLVISDYDYIFIDVSPASDVLALSMLFSIDTILIPSDFSPKSLHHAANLHDIDIGVVRRNRIKKDKEKLHLGPWSLGIVYSNCPNELKPGSQLGKMVEDELKNKGFKGKFCQTQLKIYEQTKKAEFKNVPVICWPKSPITLLYNDLVNEVFLSHNFVDN